jgi:hypothetical protein
MKSLSMGFISSHNTENCSHQAASIYEQLGYTWAHGLSLLNQEQLLYVCCQEQDVVLGDESEGHSDVYRHCTVVYHNTSLIINTCGILYVLRGEREKVMYVISKDSSFGSFRCCQRCWQRCACLQFIKSVYSLSQSCESSSSQWRWKSRCSCHTFLIVICLLNST